QQREERYIPPKDVILPEEVKTALNMYMSNGPSTSFIVHGPFDIYIKHVGALLFGDDIQNLAVSGFGEGRNFLIPRLPLRAGHDGLGAAFEIRERVECVLEDDCIELPNEIRQHSGGLC